MPIQLKVFLTNPKYKNTLFFLNNYEKGWRFYESLIKRSLHSFAEDIAALYHNLNFEELQERSKLCKEKRKFSGSDFSYHLHVD